MPRMSIYLPDDLAERLKGVEDSTASSVIQEALRRHFGPGDNPAGRAWAQPPSDATKRVFQATAKLRDEAIADFQAGYSAALERLSDLDLMALTSFARGRFDLVPWLKGWQDPKQPQWMWKIAEDVGSIADPLGYDHLSFRRTAAFEHGYSAALRAAYEAVERGDADETASTDSESGQEAPAGDLTQ